MAPWHGVCDDLAPKHSSPIGPSRPNTLVLITEAIKVSFIKKPDAKRLQPTLTPHVHYTTTTMFGSLTRCLTVALLTSGRCYCAHAFHRGGKAFCTLAGGAGGMDPEGVIDRLALLPDQDFTFVTNEFLKLQSQVGRALPSGVGAQRAVSQPAVPTVVRPQSLATAMELAATSKEAAATAKALYRAERMTAAALARAGVVDVRTFLGGSSCKYRPQCRTSREPGGRKDESCEHGDERMCGRTGHSASTHTPGMPKASTWGLFCMVEWVQGGFLF